MTPHRRTLSPALSFASILRQAREKYLSYSFPRSLLWHSVPRCGATQVLLGLESPPTGHTVCFISCVQFKLVFWMYNYSSMQQVVVVPPKFLLECWLSPSVLRICLKDSDQNRITWMKNHSYNAHDSWFLLPSLKKLEVFLNQICVPIDLQLSALKV